MQLAFLIQHQVCHYGRFPIIEILGRRRACIYDAYRQRRFKQGTGCADRRCQPGRRAFLLVGYLRRNVLRTGNLYARQISVYSRQGLRRLRISALRPRHLIRQKFQAKRNHINKFKKTYNYEYTPITADRIRECLDLEAEWCKVNNCDQHEGTGNERRALIYALHNFDALGLTGGILHVEGKIAAFTFGMPINQDTFGVHVEKADTRIDGAYAIINYEFANHIPEQYIYINREEDLGIEGLRKAKLSYQPAIILEKYVACLKEQPVEAIK